MIVPEYGGMASGNGSASARSRKPSDALVMACDTNVRGLFTAMCDPIPEIWKALTPCFVCRAVRRYGANIEDSSNANTTSAKDTPGTSVDTENPRAQLCSDTLHRNIHTRMKVYVYLRKDGMSSCVEKFMCNATGITYIIGKPPMPRPNSCRL